VLKTLLVIAIGFLPSLISLWVIRKTHLRTRSRMRQAAINLSGIRIQQYIRPADGNNLHSNLGVVYPRSVGVPPAGSVVYPRSVGVPPAGSVVYPRSDRYYLEGVGYLIGDISCKFNARSGYIRCAVNPSGPCQDCRYYESPIPKTNF
jgi:Family of unknown function (DUF6464)